MSLSASEMFTCPRLGGRSVIHGETCDPPAGWKRRMIPSCLGRVISKEAQKSMRALVTLWVATGPGEPH